MHITLLAYFPVLVKVLHNELPWKCPKLDGLSTLFCIIVGNMTLYHTINTLCISTDYLVTRWQRLLVHNSGYFHKTHLFKVTNDPPVLFLHYRKRYSRPLESESTTRTQIVEVPWLRRRNYRDVMPSVFIKKIVVRGVESVVMHACLLDLCTRCFKGLLIHSGSGAKAPLSVPLFLYFSLSLSLSTPTFCHQLFRISI